MAKSFQYRWKQGAKYAPEHEVWGQIVSDLHGGDPRVYAAWIQRQDNMLDALKTLRDNRQLAWDLLLGIEP